MSRTAFLFHGSNGTPEENWFPWIKQELDFLGYKIVSPQFPTPEGQNVDEWMKVFESYSSSTNENSIFIGHSIGALFSLLILEKYGIKIEGVFLVSGFIQQLGDSRFDNLTASFTSKRLDWQKIRSLSHNFYLYHGGDDPYVPVEQAKKLAKILGVETRVFPKGGHLNKEAGFRDFPRLSLDITSLPSNNEIFADFFLGLSETKKTDRVLRSLPPIRKIAETELALIKKLKDPSIPKRGAHFWLFTMVEGFWEDVDYIVRQAKRQDKYHVVPYIRTLLEKLSKVGYFIKLSEEEQEKRTDKELLKIAHRYYTDAPELDEEERDFWEKKYNEINDGSFPSVSEVRYEDLDPFPEGAEAVIHGSGLENPAKWYSHYRFLSDAGHGSLFYSRFRKQEQHAEFRRALMYLLPMCIRMNDWINVCMRFGLDKEVYLAMRAAEAVSKKGLKEFVRGFEQQNTNE